MNIEKIIQNIKEKSPIVHCITNYVTVNDCANILLAVGASPIMADDLGEVTEITSISSALVINIGTLNRNTIESMILAGKTANEKGIPVVLDPVGVGASKLRNDTAKKLLDNVKFSVIRGNASEIKFLNTQNANTKGVDVSSEDIISGGTLNKAIDIAKDVANMYEAIVSVSGEIDIITDGTDVNTVSEGDAMMSKITGSGCMLSALMGGFVAANKDNIFESVTAANKYMATCGQLAASRVKTENSGLGSFRVYMFDYLSSITPSSLV